MKKYPFKKGQRVMSMHGRGTVVGHDYGRPGIVHDTFPANKPRMYKDDILYYFRHDFSEELR